MCVLCVVVPSCGGVCSRCRCQFAGLGKSITCYTDTRDKGCLSGRKRYSVLGLGTFCTYSDHVRPARPCPLYTHSSLIYLTRLEPSCFCHLHCESCICCTCSVEFCVAKRRFVPHGQAQASPVLHTNAL